MRKFLVLICFLASCSASTVNEQSKSVSTQNPVVAQANDNSDSTQKLNDSISNIWQMKINNRVRTAVVMTNGKTPNGDAQTILWLQCPTGLNPVVSINYIVRDSNNITDFDFDSFEGPDAPAKEKNLVEIQAVSPHGNLSFRILAGGYYGGAGEPDAFVFGTSTTKQDKIMQLAQMIANGSTEVTFIVHDYLDYSKTIETKFPVIDPSSDVAKILNGCRK